MASDNRILCEWAEANELALPQSFLDDVEIYYEALLEGNKRFNLTRITDRDAYLVKHVIDALVGVLAMPTLLTGRHRIIDVGAGPGIPAVFLARINPSLKVTALDGTGKKMRWLGEVAESANWTNLTALHGRSEEIQRRKPYTGGFDLVTARAVAPAPKILRNAHQLLAPGATMLLYKTPAQMEEEVEEVGTLTPKLHLTADYTPVFELPADAGQRAFWKIRRGEAAKHAG